SAAQTAVGSPDAAVEPLGLVLLPLFDEHAARMSSSAARTALSRKSLCIRSPPGSSGRREVSRPRRKVGRIIAAPRSRTQGMGSVNLRLTGCDADLRIRCRDAPCYAATGTSGSRELRFAPERPHG